MKRIIGVILTAVFLFGLCIPCAAEVSESASMKRRGYPGFSDIPSTESPYYGAVKTCYEAGLMNGTSETTFSPQGKLNIAQLVVLAARLYDLCSGGDGSVPDLPDLSQSYLRFYGADGGLIASFPTWEELPSYNTITSAYIALSETPDDPALPEACTMEVGFDGYGTIRRYEGVRETYTPVPGTMSQGFTGTGYRFADPEAGRFVTLPSAEITEELKESWWYPAAFYLASEGKLTLDGELIFRASGGDIQGYDAKSRFSSDNAARALFAWLVDLAAGDLPVLNETVNVPDVDPNETQDADAILRLYQAGILTGIDAAGNFNGSGELTRGQAAIMLARVLDPGSRVQAG